MKNLQIILLFIVVNFFQTLNASATTDELESIFANAVEKFLRKNGGHTCLVNTNKGTAGRYNTFIHIPEKTKEPAQVFLIRFDDQNSSHCENLEIDKNKHPSHCINISFLNAVPNFIRSICNNKSKLKLEFEGFYTARFNVEPLDDTELFLKAAKNMDSTHIKAIYRKEGYIFLLSTDESGGISPARLIVQDGSVYNLMETTEGIRQGNIKPALKLIKEKDIQPRQVRSIGLEGRFLTQQMELYIPNPPQFKKYTLIKPDVFKTRVEKANQILPIEDISSIDWNKIYSGLLIRLLDPQYEFPPPDKQLLEKYRFFQHLLIYLEE